MQPKLKRVRRRPVHYKVSFFKKLTDSTGHQFDVLQGRVDVHSDRKSRALRKARLRFAGLKNVVEWSLRADYEKVELIADREQISDKMYPLGLGSLDHLLQLS